MKKFFEKFFEDSDFHIATKDLKKFKVVEFERRPDNSLKNRLKKSIIQNGILTPIVLTVWENGAKEKPFLIIDGQHRFLALQDLLLEEGFRKSFKVTLHKIKAKNEAEAAHIYRKLNTDVKGTTMKDILKTYCNIYPDFFVLLNRYCRDYGDKEYIPFVDVLQAIKYAKTKNAHTMRRDDVEETIKRVKVWEIKRAAQFIDSLYEKFGRDRDLFIYKSGVFRALFRIFWENFEDMITRKWDTFLNKANSCKFLKDTSQHRSVESVTLIYNALRRLL